MDKKNLELITNLRHELHENPYISMNEEWTKNHLMNFIKTHTNLDVIDQGRWFYAVYRSGEGKKNIAFEADMDALPMTEKTDLPYKSKNPGAAHKCGHEGHSAALAGLALEVEQMQCDKNIFFVFQHAEEIGAGAKESSQIVIDEKIDEIFKSHNESGYEEKAIIYIKGVHNCASKGMVIKFKGRESHASAPEKGINPAFAIAEIINQMPEYVSEKKNKGLVLSTIVGVSVGERNFGISAGEGELALTIRALYEDELDQLQANLENAAKKEAEKYGLAVSFEFLDEFPETASHDSSVKTILTAAKNLGMKIVEAKEAHRGSEDFGYYTKLTKGAYFCLGNGLDYPDVHTDDFDYNDNLLEPTVEMYKEIIRISK